MCKQGVPIGPVSARLTPRAERRACCARSAPLPAGHPAAPGGDHPRRRRHPRADGAAEPGLQGQRGPGCGAGHRVGRQGGWGACATGPRLPAEPLDACDALPRDGNSLGARGGEGAQRCTQPRSGRFSHAPPFACRLGPSLQRVIDFYGVKPEGKVTLLVDDPVAKGERRAAASGDRRPRRAAAGAQRCRALRAVPLAASLPACLRPPGGVLRQPLRLSGALDNPSSPVRRLPSRCFTHPAPPSPTTPAAKYLKRDVKPSDVPEFVREYKASAARGQEPTTPSGLAPSPARRAAISTPMPSTAQPSTAQHALQPCHRSSVRPAQHMRLGRMQRTLLCRTTMPPAGGCAGQVAEERGGARQERRPSAGGWHLCCLCTPAGCGQRHPAPWL